MRRSASVGRRPTGGGTYNLACDAATWSGSSDRSRTSRRHQSSGILTSSSRKAIHSASTACQPAFRAAAGPRPWVPTMRSGADVFGSSSSVAAERRSSAITMQVGAGSLSTVATSSARPGRPMVGMTTAYEKLIMVGRSIMVAAPGKGRSRVHRPVLSRRVPARLADCPPWDGQRY